MTTRIKSISGQNFKGRTFTTPLATRTLIAGPNFSGKTTITEAIRLALLGKLPELGSRNSDAFDLASGGAMEVSIVLTDDQGQDLRFDRRFSMVRGAITQKGEDVPEEYLSPLLSAETWFGLTESQRVDFVFRNVQMPPDKTLDGIVASLEQITLAEEHTEAFETAKRKTIAGVKETLQRERAFEPENLPKALVRAEEELAEEATLWNRRAKDGDGAIRTLTELKLAEDQASAITLTDLRNDADRIQGLLAAANQALGGLTSQLKASTSSTECRRQIAAGLEEGAPVLEGLPEAPEGEQQAIRMRSAILHANELLAKQPEETTTEARKTYEGLATKYAALDRDRLRAIADRDEQTTLLADIDALKECPHCHSKTKGWKDVIRTTITTELQRCQAEAERLQTECDAVDTACKEAFALLRGIETRMASREETLRNISLSQTIIDRYEAVVTKWKATVERIQHDNTSRKVNYDNRQKALREELARLETVPAPIDTELQAGRAEVQRLTADLATAREAIRKGEALQNDLKRAEEASQIALEAQARRDVIKVVRERLAITKGELVTAAFGELLRVANAIVGDLLTTPLAYDAGTNQVGRFGRTGFISHKTFSGTEKALTYVAIAAALSSKSKLRVLMLDELARLTPEVQGFLMGKLSSAISAGLIDQVIVIMPSDKPLPSMGDWTAINMGAIN